MSSKTVPVCSNNSKIKFMTILRLLNKLAIIAIMISLQITKLKYLSEPVLKQLNLSITLASS